MLSKLIAALQNAELEMTAEEIADMLWLALQMDFVAGSPGTGPEADISDETRPDETEELADQFSQKTPPPSSTDIHMNSHYSNNSSISHLTGLPFRSPAASALPDTLSLARALKPFMRRLSSKTIFVFNENATVQTIAEAQNNIWLPILDPAPVRWFDIALVIDEGASMVLWKDTIVELRVLLENLGAFRDVRVWRLTTDDRKSVQLYAETGFAKEQSFARNPKELIDPSGRRLILVVTDCISLAWHSGGVQQLLDIWGKKNLVTLIQMLPRRLWHQTALDLANTVQISASLQEIANASIKTLQPFQWLDEDTSFKASFPVPVVTLEPKSLLSWSRIITGLGGTWITGKVFEKNSDADADADNHPSIQEEPLLSARKRVQLFNANASHIARKLAGLLAAAPVPVSLQVIRLIRQTMLPQAGQVHIAEVLLSGLLEEIYRDEMATNPDHVEYDFIAGIRDELLNAVPIPDGQRVLREISTFIGQYYGQTRDFLAIVATQERSKQNVIITGESRPFAQIAATVLRRFGGDFASLAKNLEQQIRQFNSLPSVKPVDLFVAYAHEDQELRDQFMDHLKLLINQGLMSEYYESDVTHTEEQAQVLEHLTTAKVILLLVSIDFMNSDFIDNSHLKEAIARHWRGEAYVIPILLRPVSWEDTPFAQLPRLPGNNRAITLWADRSKAFSEIIESIRLVLMEQGREVLPPVNAGQSGPSYPLADVFVTSSIPKVTYVESKDFERLKLTLSQKRRSIVIEGPSGIGKTTAIQKAIEEIQSKSSIAGSKKIEIKSLNARDPDHVTQLNTLDEWHRGTVVIDDFHALDVQLRKKIVDYLKLLADTGAETKKLVIVGIPQSGQKLIDLSFDAASRIGVFQWGKEKDELVLQMIEKGEQALNIRLKHKMELAILASGSLNVAQFLCYEVCHQEGVTTTQPRLHVIDSTNIDNAVSNVARSTNINNAVSNVITALARKFEEVTTFFAGMGGTRDSTCLHLLKELAASENGYLDLFQLKEQRPELSSGIERFISEKWMETLYKKHNYSQYYFFFDSSTYTLMINDPQLTFYLRQVMPYSKLARDAGIEVAIRQRKVFIGYCKEDDHFLKRLQIHFQPQADRGFIDLWDDTKLKAGTPWEKELQTAIETASVAILLVSPDFLASDFIWKYQLPRLLAQAEAGGTKIIPLVVAPCAFERSKLSVFHPFKFSGRALSEMKKPERERKFTELTEFILNELMREKSQN